MRRGMPLEQFVKWRRIIRRILTAVVVGATLLVAWADHRGWLLEHGRAWFEQVTSFKIVKVLAGDSIQVVALNGQGEPQQVGLLGVEAIPERQVAGISELIERHCRRQPVQLLEWSRPAGSSRWLAYVVLPDGTLLNERLLLDGLVRADPRFNHSHLHRFMLIEQQARHDGSGIWTPRPSPSS